MEAAILAHLVRETTCHKIKKYLYHLISHNSCCVELKDVRRKEEQQYVEHPDAAEKGFSKGLQFLRDRGVIGGSKVGKLLALAYCVFFV